MLVLRCNGMKGFHAEKEFPSELNGLINQLDYKYILYKFNAQITSLKISLIRLFITNIISAIICIVLYIISKLHISSQWLNLEITAGIGLFGLVLSMWGIHALNKKIMKNLEGDVKDLTSRYREEGIQFSVQDKPKSDNENGFSKLLCTASNYNIELQIGSSSGSFDKLHQDISIRINPMANDKTPLINN
ncbi:hypothetical protein SAMD00019534_034100 [Acytostelium subglobosum LB1]|uniref:hypothetical protein n=1 Tax=Acytostelium subglobosum LB1 TaxID=1410327 RepID=UPI000644CE7F|nr:hypothetical protein SAMD00019534_034100 [Acytostelium subglobosum LB1]GAM20235.1 hypothetical protein SAMD00019534_034100 [Acytostelium subglobosum LB1]|eukprot:XP_012759756.1 hypothetical protein SAMD00019534_034100 [Acytostelium subglobosum LB1]